MTGSHLQQVPDNGAPIQPYSDAGAPEAWDEGGVEAPNRGALQLQRYAAAIWRFKWLILLLVMAGGAGGTVATRFVEPEYSVQAVLVLSSDGSATGQTDGFQQAGLLDLLSSYAVVDPVVTQLNLHLTPKVASDSALFRSFTSGLGVLAGEYSLRINGSNFELWRNGSQLVQRGTLTDEIGASVQFSWTPGAEALQGKQTVEFTIRTPREVSNELINKLNVPRMRVGSNILRLSLTGTDAKRTEQTLNMWTENFLAVATQYKRANVTQKALIFDGQLGYAREQLASAEAALGNFKIRTAEMPSESRMPQIAGPEVTSNPVFSAYFNQTIQSEQLRRDREWIERALTADSDGGVRAEALLSIPSVNSAPAAAKLRADLSEAMTMESELRKLRLEVTEENPRYQRPFGQLQRLRTVVIPAAARAFLAQLDQQAADLEGNLSESRQDLRNIPSRTMELMRLERELSVADAQYRSLLVQAQDAKLAEATTPTDLRVLSPAVEPLRPTNKTGPILIIGAIGAALALGIALAILLDMLDKRFRYPQQATDELGLFILGVIPELSRKRRRSVEDAAQMVEAFRTVRMNMRYAVDPSRPFAVTISSPGPNDGKSLIASNLALSFADGGSRVILVDGDVRRGALEETFKVSNKPGLVDYLDGAALLPEVMRDTHHPNLTLIPCGKRQRRAPELLTGPRLTQLVELLKRDYDVVIVDSPPLGAGSDAYALGIASGNMVIVLRAGLSDRKMAAAKLRTLETLPVRILGGVLNSIRMTGQYQYYSYYLDYAAKDEDQVKSLPSAPPARAAVVKAAGD
jgi:capsular exopolysaccharide synthesis family protein